MKTLPQQKEAFSDGCSSNERSWHNIIKEHVNKIISEDEYKKQLNKFISQNYS